jgi:lipid-A-disaccharide synthase-like uncharacterized protein
VRNVTDGDHKNPLEQGDSMTVGPWLVLGFAAQALFAGRFVVQWIVSERRRQSVIPRSFWYLSLAGSALLLVYAIHRRDPVFILGQAFGLVVYARNLALDRGDSPAA